MITLPFTITPAETALVVTLLGKWFIMAADSMPPPPPMASYGQRWFYDFIQRVASNSAKVGSVRPTITPNVVETTVPATPEAGKPKE